MRLRTVAARGCLLWLAGGGCTSTTGTEPPRAVTLRISGTSAKDLQRTAASLPDIRFQVVTEGGSSITSLHDLRSGKIDLSMPMADVAYLAYSGQLDEMNGSFDQLRGLAVLSLNTVYLVVGAHTRVQEIRDLKGLRISLGPPGSAMALIAARLIEAHGIRMKDITGVQLANPEFTDALAKRRIDAAFVIFGQPNDSVTRAVRAGARLIEIEGPAIEELRTRYPYLKRTVITPRMYPNQNDPVHTIGIDALLVSRADVDERVIYRLMEAYFATRPSTRPPDLERAPATPIPLHPGAARYYRQRELSR